ncbi:MAG: hypothetical protein LBS35_07420 [Synergistaceae bacterium]|jgi:hypothetical protein|nr:hypothetical protein [Synergistaceae bacterium]
MLGNEFPNAGIIYRDVRIEAAQWEKSKNLRLWGIHNRRDYLDILYEDVIYSQIDDSNSGLHITLVEELNLDEFFDLRHNMGRNRMLHEEPERFAEFIHAVGQEDYRIYAHYTLKEDALRTVRGTEERLVLARRVQVEGPEERLARHERENRRYKFYAYVSHAEGGEDEKWGRWIQRRLENFRIPVDAVSKLQQEELAEPAPAKSISPEPVPRKISAARGEIHQGDGPVSPSDAARYLIVICSPRGSRSERVERDARAFTENGRGEYIIPFIIGGELDGTEEKRCYPPSLSAEFLGVTLADGSKEEALMRIIARLLRVKFSRLYQRHLRERREVIARVLAAASVAAVLLLGLTAWAVSREIEAARRRDEAGEIARFLIRDFGNDPRLPLGIRTMIDKKTRDYQERHDSRAWLALGIRATLDEKALEYQNLAYATDGGKKLKKGQKHGG